MPRFSIIVPYLGDDVQFENTLASVLRYQPRHADVIVVHDGTYEDAHHLEGEIQFVQTERRAQVNRMFSCGLRHSTSEFVAFIRPGVELTDNWDEIVSEAFEASDRVASVSPALISPENEKQLVAAGVDFQYGMNRKIVGVDQRMNPRRLRSLKPLGPTSWAAFYRRSALERVGTPDETLDPVYLDLDLALGLKAVGFHNSFVHELVIHTRRPKQMLREADQPHGQAAQRAVRRHPSFSNKHSFVSTAIWELVRSPIKPALFKHFSSRFSANQFSDIDEAYAQRLKKSKTMATLDNERTIPIPMPLRKSA